MISRAWLNCETSGWILSAVTTSRVLTPWHQGLLTNTRLRTIALWKISVVIWKMCAHTKVRRSQDTLSNTARAISAWLTLVAAMRAMWTTCVTQSVTTQSWITHCLSTKKNAPLASCGGVDSLALSVTSSRSCYMRSSVERMEPLACT